MVVASIRTGFYGGSDSPLDARHRIPGSGRAPFKPVESPVAPAVAVARIRYPEDVEPGCLIYLKPSYHIHNSPIDVRAYAEANAAFPH